METVTDHFAIRPVAHGIFSVRRLEDGKAGQYDVSGRHVAGQHFLGRGSAAALIAVWLA